MTNKPSLVLALMNVTDKHAIFSYRQDFMQCKRRYSCYSEVDFAVSPRRGDTLNLKVRPNFGFSLPKSDAISEICEVKFNR